MKKYELINPIKNGTTTLWRLKAIRSFGDVKKGQLGGHVENDYNLSHNGSCWLYNGAWCFDQAKIEGDARVLIGSYINNDARLYGSATVKGGRIYDYCQIGGAVIVEGTLMGEVNLFGNEHILRGELLKCWRTPKEIEQSHQILMYGQPEQLINP
jgi:hypothetical protein